MDSEAFYQERDSRTLKLVDKADYRNKRLLIAINDNAINTFNGQVMAYTALNLAGRFCRNIDIYCNPTAKARYSLPRFEAKHFPDAMIEMLRKIDPSGNFNLVTHQRKKYDAILSIGSSESLHDVSVTIDNDGWLSFVTKGKRRFRKHHKSNPIGAGVAACLGVGEIFKNLISRDNFTEYIQNVCFSALDYSVDQPDQENPELPRVVKLSKVQMVGVGAIGSATLAFLDLLPLEGEIELIDFDSIDISNLNRYPIATIDDVGRSKVAVGRDYISHHENLSVSTFWGKYEKYVNEKGRGDADVVLPLVDNNEARHQVQLNLPRLTIYGTTGDWVVTIARHKALEDDCIICRYPKREEADLLPCGTVNIAQPKVSGNNETQEINAAISFVSALAGVLVTGELVKINYAEDFTYNFFQTDLASTPHHTRHFQRHPAEGCICRQPWFRLVYEKILNRK